MREHLVGTRESPQVARRQSRERGLCRGRDKNSCAGDERTSGAKTAVDGGTDSGAQRREPNGSGRVRTAKKASSTSSEEANKNPHANEFTSQGDTPPGKTA